MRRPVPIRPCAPVTRWLVPLFVVLWGLGACGGDTGTEPVPATGILATDQASWSLTHGLISALPHGSCDSDVPWRDDNTPLKTTSFVEGSWQGRTFSGTWTHRVQTWDDFEVTGSLEATITRDDSLVTSFVVDQHIVWNLAENRHRHEVAHMAYDGPGLRLGDENWGYVFRDFGETCCSGLTFTWSTWLEEDPECTYTTERIECVEVSTLHVGFYPRD